MGLVVYVAKRTKKKDTTQIRAAHYVILAGIIILLIGFYLAVFARVVTGGAVILFIGVIISILGLSNHSLHLWRRKTRRA